MANYEQTKYDYSGQFITGVQGVNTGLIIPWTTGSIPSGFLECDGTAVSRTTYAALFAVVGTTYGTGDGSTTFNLPNLTDRVAVHKSPTKSFATTGGANTVASGGSISGPFTVGNTTLTTPTIAAHNHTDIAGLTTAGGLTGNAGGGTRGAETSTFGPTVTITTDAAGGGGAHTHTANAATFTGNATSVLQPYLTLKYIIKT